jgi:glutamate dehydrogenase
MASLLPGEIGDFDGARLAEAVRFTLATASRRLRRTGGDDRKRGRYVGRTASAHCRDQRRHAVPGRSISATITAQG